MIVKVSIDRARRRLTGNRAATVFEDDSGANGAFEEAGID